MTTQGSTVGSRQQARGTLALVAAGGAVGVLLRFALEVALTDLAGGRGAMVLANVSGSFALGLLVTRFSSSPGSGRMPWVMPALGTGLLGGYTTYSGLAVATVDTARDVGLVPSALLLVVTVAAGLLACLAGVRLGSRGRVR